MGPICRPLAVRADPPFLSAKPPSKLPSSLWRARTRRGTCAFCERCKSLSQYLRLTHYEWAANAQQHCRETFETVTPAPHDSPTVLFAHRSPVKGKVGTRFRRRQVQPHLDRELRLNERHALVQMRLHVKIGRTFEALFANFRPRDPIEAKGSKILAEQAMADQTKSRRPRGKGSGSQGSRSCTRPGHNSGCGPWPSQSSGYDIGEPADQAQIIPAKPPTSFFAAPCHKHAFSRHVAYEGGNRRLCHSL
jgi:hypothetical protein